MKQRDHEQGRKEHQHEGEFEPAGQYQFRVESVAVIDLRLQSQRAHPQDYGATSRMPNAAKASGEGASQVRWKL